MKKIFLIFPLTISVFGYSQKDFLKKEIVSRNNKPIHFQIWKNNELILNSTGSAKGEESFPASKGKYKLIIFDEQDKPKTKIFHI